MSEHNLVVLRGTLSSEPRTRELPSGSVLSQFDVTTRDAGGTQSVPVAWFDPPASVAELEAGAELVVLGSVRRRFFRAGGSDPVAHRGRRREGRAGAARPRRQAARRRGLPRAADADA